MSKTNHNLYRLLEKSFKALNKNGFLLIDFTNYNWLKFKEKNFFRDSRHKWFVKKEITNTINKFNKFKIKKIVGFLPAVNKTVAINKSHSIFLTLKKV